jgi:SNF2 family DNA or RNA helicase
VTAGVYAELTADMKSIVLEVTGDDYELDQAAKALRKLTPLLKPTEPKGGLICPATWAAATQLGATFNNPETGRWIPLPRLKQWIFDEFMRRHNEDRPLNVDLPPGLVPRPYQWDAAGLIGSMGKVLLFDDPGTGKTVSAILGLRNRHNIEHIFPMLIVVPSWDVADVWVRHIKVWAGAGRNVGEGGRESVGAVGGGRDESGRGVSSLRDDEESQVWPDPELYRGPGRKIHRDADRIYITTYAGLRIGAADASGPLVKLKPAAVVADEVHLAKNESSKQSRALRRVAAHAGTFVGLTGTPITRDTGDVYPVLAAMEPLSWPDRHRFVKRYLDTNDDGYGESIEGLQALREPEFRTAIAGQYRRVAKADVLDQLPPKVYSTRNVELPPEWRKAYDGMADQMLAELPDGQELEVMSVLAQLTRLGQFAASATDVEITETTDPVNGETKKHFNVTLRSPSWKVDALHGVLEERPGQQVVVFTVSRQLADIAGESLTDRGYRCGFITGAQSAKSRAADIDMFQAGGLDVMIATAGAGSLGITLTAAGTAVFLQRSWELDKALQPEDRLHRIGQEHDCVEIIDIIARDTVDDRVRELMRVKGGHLGQLVRDPRIVKELLGGLKLCDQCG